MQLHTFIVDSALEAVERIRTELGPEAVVVSVRKLPANGLSRLWKHEQVEVVAGVGAPAQPADSLQELRAELRDLRAQVSGGPPRPGEGTTGSLLDICDTGALSSAGDLPEAETRAGGVSLSRLLVQTGLLPMYAEQVEQEILAAGGVTRPDGFTRGLELARTYLKARWLARPAGYGKTHLFVGPPGSGKSTVLAKWLAQAVLSENQPATVYQLDTHVANVSPLPSLYAEILGSGFERALPGEWDPAGISFIDLPGFQPGDAKGLAVLGQVLQAVPGCQVHLVLNAAYETATLMTQARAWSRVGALNLILTHLDEEPRWGKAWNLVIGTNYRVSHFSSGQNIPGDFIPATPETLFGRQFGPK